MSGLNHYYRRSHIAEKRLIVAVCRVFRQFQLYQITVQLKTIVHRLSFRVVTYAKFYQTIFEIASDKSPSIFSEKLCITESYKLKCL